MMDLSKRVFLRAAGVLIAHSILSRPFCGRDGTWKYQDGGKVIIVIFGGVRNQETW
jgi:hypothetical protein